MNPPTALETPYRQLSWLYLCFVNSWLFLTPSRLSADWRFGAVPVVTSLVDSHNILTVATLVVVTMLAVRGLVGTGEGHKKTILFAVSLVVFPYIPASNLFFPVGFVVAERVLYLPSMGFSMLVGYGAWCLMQRTNKRLTKSLLTLAIGYLIAVHSLKTLVRNRSWYSSYSIYSSGVRFNPKNGVMLSNLGIEYAITRDYTQAERLYRTSVEVAPSYSRGFYNLGKLLKMMHRYYEAEEVRSLIFNLLLFECRKVVCRLPRQLPTCTSYWLSHKSLGTKSDLQAMLSLVRDHELHVVQDLLTPSEHLVSMITHHIGGQGPLHSEQYLWLIAPLPGPSQESLYIQCVHVTHVNTQTE